MLSRVRHTWKHFMLSSTSQAPTLHLLAPPRVPPPPPPTIGDELNAIVIGQLFGFSSYCSSKFTVKKFGTETLLKNCASNTAKKLELKLVADSGRICR